MKHLPDQTRLRVASYNIRKARGLDQRRNPTRILAVINHLGADVVALQEADRRFGDRPSALCRGLIERETDFQVADLAPNEVSLGWHGNAILIRKGMRSTDAKRIDLPGLEPRGAVSIQLNTVDPLVIVGTHLGLTRYHRRKQLRTITNGFGSSDHAVIVGDFNEWSPSVGLEPITERFDVHAPGRTYHAAQPLAALDRIAVTYGLQLCASGVEDGPLARRASDHLPIWADIAVSPGRAAISNTEPAALHCAADRG